MRSPAACGGIGRKSYWIVSPGGYKPQMFEETAGGCFFVSYYDRLLLATVICYGYQESGPASAVDQSAFPTN